MRDLICGVDYSLSHTKLRYGHKVQLTSAFFACISLNSQAMKSTRIIYMILVIRVKFIDPTFSIFFQVFDQDFIINIYLTHIAASSTMTGNARQ